MVAGDDGALLDGLVALLAMQQPGLTAVDLEAFRVAIAERWGGERHWIATPKLDTDALVQRVSALLGTYSEREIARRLGVTKMRVNRIKHRILEMRAPWRR